MHYEFLSKILQSNTNYWCVAKMVTANSLGREERRADQIALIAIDYSTQLSIPANEIKFIELEKLGRSDVSNIFLNVDYPPFQLNVTLYDVYDGFPLNEGHIKEFLREALTLKTPTSGLYPYKELYKTIIEANKPL